MTDYLQCVSVVVACLSFYAILVWGLARSVMAEDVFGMIISTLSMAVAFIGLALAAVIFNMNRMCQRCCYSNQSKVKSRRVSSNGDTCTVCESVMAASAPLCQLPSLQSTEPSTSSRYLLRGQLQIVEPEPINNKQQGAGVTNSWQQEEMNALQNGTAERKATTAGKVLKSAPHTYLQPCAVYIHPHTSSAPVTAPRDHNTHMQPHAVYTQSDTLSATTTSSSTPVADTRSATRTCSSPSRDSGAHLQSHAIYSESQTSPSANSLPSAHLQRYDRHDRPTRHDALLSTFTTKQDTIAVVSNHPRPGASNVSTVLLPPHN